MRTLDRTLVTSIAIALTFMHGAASARADPAPTLHGSAEVRGAEAGAAFKAASDGAPLALGTTVRAASADAPVRVDLSETVSVALGAGAVLGVQSLGRLPAETPGAKAPRAIQLTLVSGEIEITSPATPDPASQLGVTVFLPGGRSFSLWRGSATVSLAGDRILFSLFDGMAIIGAGAKWRPLGPGKTATMSKDEIAMHDLPAAPEWDDAHAPAPPFALVRGAAGGAALGAAWRPVAGAATYRTELAREGGAKGPVTLGATTATSLRTPLLDAGTYLLRVRAVTADGALGPVTRPKTLRVARLTAPPGASVTASGAIVLPRDTAARFDDVADLEVATVVSHGATDAQLTWNDAGPLLLGTDDVREVRVRHKTTRLEDTIVLARRVLRATLSFSPRPAHWPADTVTARVRLEDPTGYLDTATERIAVKTKIDGNDVPLTWAHSGDTWTASLPRWEYGAGPWVVRMNVTDSAGADIGGGLLDVDPTATSALAVKGTRN